MRTRRFPTYALLAIAVCFAASSQLTPYASSAASTIAIADLLANSTTYSGNHVTVSGSVANVAQKTSHAGNEYETFDLCDVNGECVRVFTWGHPALNEGDKITVRGTFSATKHVSGYTFHNEIEADESSL